MNVAQKPTTLLLQAPPKSESVLSVMLWGDDKVALRFLQNEVLLIYTNAFVALLSKSLKTLNLSTKLSFDISY